MRKRVSVEDAIDFHNQSKTYTKVLEHRRKCPKWTKQFCFDCFGGGLTQFTKDLEEEKARRNLKLI